MMMMITDDDNDDNDDKFVSKFRFGFALRPVHQRRVPWMHGEGNDWNMQIKKLNKEYEKYKSAILDLHLFQTKKIK